MPLQFKGDLIAKPVGQAISNFVKSDQLRTKQNAQQAAKIEEKALKVQNSGSFAGAPNSVNSAGRVAIDTSVNVYRKSGQAKDLAAADTFVDDVNYATKGVIEDNVKFVEIAGNLDGDIDFDDMPKMSEGSSRTAFDNALAIYGNDNSVIATYNSNSRQYEFYNNDTNKNIIQNEVLENIFEKNTKFGTMVVGEVTRQGSRDMSGVSRYIDYNKHLSSKGQIVSAFWDNHIPGVPSVNEHLGSPSYANVESEDFDLKKVKEETIKYYNSIFDSEQSGYKQRNPEGNKTVGTIKQRESNTFFKNMQTNIAAGDPSTIWGENQVQMVEFRRNPRYPKEDRLAKLYVKGTDQVIPGYNLETHPFPNAPALYTRGDKTFKFFDPNNEKDIQFLANKLKVIL